MWFWFFILSATINVLLVLYVRWLLKTIAAINEDIESLSETIEDFTGHIQSVYELEMFYGDDTLKTLMEHSRQLTDQLKDLDLILNDDERGRELAEEEETQKN